ncbi:MAG: energy transducer TonB, partial [Chloroflexi bacterium]|nr:energy transducer TonB [Chloroflexota bacterium]
NSANQGIAGGTGNQGKPGGNVNSNNYTGDGGSGGGPGKGNGTGIGDSNGPGISYNLTGRTAIYLDNNLKGFANEEGCVVVKITTDKKGKITNAVPGVKGSTITDQNLLNKCKKAALNSTFNSDSKAAIDQQGTITYLFKKLN